MTEFGLRTARSGIVVTFSCILYGNSKFESETKTPCHSTVTFVPNGKNFNKCFIAYLCQNDFHHTDTGNCYYSLFGYDQRGGVCAVFECVTVSVLHRFPGHQASRPASRYPPKSELLWFVVSGEPKPFRSPNRYFGLTVIAMVCDGDGARFGGRESSL